MTGTPSGVAAFMKPPAWLQDGDIVDVEISSMGVIKNMIKFSDLITGIRMDNLLQISF